MSAITLNSVSFTSPIRIKQKVTIQYRLTSAPDVPESYTVAGTGVIVNTNGFFAVPFVIEGLINCTSYTVKITNECNNLSAQQVFASPCFYTTHLSYGVYNAHNKLLVPDGNTMLSPAKISNTDLNYQSQGPVNVVLNLPYAGLAVGDIFPFILSSNFTVISKVNDTVNSIWTVTGTVPGNQDNALSVTLPAYIAVFWIAGVHWLDFASVTKVIGVYYNENGNFSQPLYNGGFGYRQTMVCELIFNAWPIPAGSAHVFTDDYQVPAGVTINSAVVNSAETFYVVDLSWPGNNKYIFNFPLKIS